MRREAVLCALMLAMIGEAQAQTPAGNPAPAGPPMTITSPVFDDGGVFPDKYTQANLGNPNLSPPLVFTNVPDGTQSFTLLVHDMDNATRRNVVDTTHWLIFNIPGATRSLPEGVPNTPTLPDGSIQAKGAAVGYRGLGYRGPVYHHYAFELFALDTKLALGPDATRDDVMKAMDGHIVGKAADVARFHR